MRGPRKAVPLRGGTDRRQRAVVEMVQRLLRGERVVVGVADEAVRPGTVMGRGGGAVLVVKRRATREEFLQAAPSEADLASAPATPFYWELGLGPVVIVATGLDDPLYQPSEGEAEYPCSDCGKGVMLSLSSQALLPLPILCVSCYAQRRRKGERFILRRAE